MSEAAELQRLRDRVEMLEDALGISPSITSRLRAAFGLSLGEARILGILMSRQLIGFDAMYSVLYGALAEDDQPSDQVVKVHIFKLRKKLKPHDIEIATLVSEGYALRPEAKRAIREHLDRIEGKETSPVVVPFDPLPTRRVA